MNKKIKIFGISAAILLMLVSIGPCIISVKADTKDDGIKPYTDLAARYQSQFDDLQAYINQWMRNFGTLEGITFTPEQQQFMRSYTIQVQEIYLQQGIPQYPQSPPPRFWGITDIFKSSNPFYNNQYPIRGSTSPLVYRTNEICMSHNFTKFWAALILAIGFLPAFITIGAILLIYYGLNDIVQWWAVMSFIWISWIAVRAFILNYIAPSGIIFYHWLGAPLLQSFQILDQPDNDLSPTGPIYRWVITNGVIGPNPTYWAHGIHW